MSRKIAETRSFQSAAAHDGKTRAVAATWISSNLPSAHLICCLASTHIACELQNNKTIFAIYHSAVRVASSSASKTVPRRVETAGRRFLSTAPSHQMGKELEELGRTMEFCRYLGFLLQH